MRGPRKQKRFSSEKTILKAMDEAERLSQAALTESDRLRAELKALRREHFKTETGWDSAIGFRKEQIVKAEKRADRYQAKKKQLGEALSRLRTMLLPIPENDDNSVVL